VSPLTPISAIEMRPVEWLIEPYVPIGKLTDVAGQMGQGKSLLTDFWAAMVTTGATPGSVLMFVCEDDVADTIRPRLEAVGADVDRIYELRDDALDAEKIKGHCDELGDVRLVTVDPLTAFFPTGVDPWKTPAVRRFLRPLIELAQRERFALVGVQHVNRSKDADPLARIADAQGIPQVARSVLVWGPDPSDPDGDSGSRKVLATAKNNLVRGKQAASFRIEDVQVTDRIAVAKLVHLGASSTDAAELVADQGSRTDTREATAWLLDYLSSGAVETEIAKKDAAGAGISDKCLRTARERIATSSRPGGNEGPYVWTLTTSSAQKWASRGIHSSSKGIHEGNHDGSEGIHESVDAQSRAWMPVDALNAQTTTATRPPTESHALIDDFDELQTASLRIVK
jgi:putative DNA primase/helicase